MGEKFKEHWQVAILSTIIGVVLASGINFGFSMISKVDDAATVQFVQESDKEIGETIKVVEKSVVSAIEKSKKYTDTELLKHTKQEEKNIQSVKDQIKNTDLKVNVIYEWVINQD